MSAANNEDADDGAADNARRRGWASPAIGMRTMGPQTIGPRMMGIAVTYVLDNGVANDGAADYARPDDGVAFGGAAVSGHC